MKADQFTRNILRLPRESILSTWTPDPTLDIAPILDQVNTPVLVLHGTEDRRVSVAAARYLTQHLPDARLHLFQGRGHLPIFTATAEFCEVLRCFVERDVAVGARTYVEEAADGRRDTLWPGFRARPAAGASAAPPARPW